MILMEVNPAAVQDRNTYLVQLATVISAAHECHAAGEDATGNLNLADGRER